MSLNKPVSDGANKVSRSPNHRPLHHRQAGSSLLEVLIAVLIMAIGMLGIAAMQTTALRNSQSSLERSQAIIQSYTILDAMRANRAAALASEYNTAGWVCAAAPGGSHATNDISTWIDSMKATMGTAGDVTTCGSIACAAATGICTISVRWDDTRAAEAGASGVEAGSATRQVQTVARI
jgi:type IV pilus assembly protein PilV